MGFFVDFKSWERKGALCEDGDFLLVARVMRGRGRCARLGDFVGCKSGERRIGHW
jgi:hypothetical protein